MAVDLCRLTTRTMNVNAGHERTSKARIIHQIQLIRGITLLRVHAVPGRNNRSWIHQVPEHIASMGIVVPLNSGYLRCHFISGRSVR
ncbi:Transposase [Shigella dysenteriae 1617]|uniref:Transposase n=1 Tax=Shigella dysenteriae 1617 TaxID=754093 RepID=A0A0A6ZTZ9_SHIDY|nr:Transposase [Shigella dysenteriae 1617]